MATDYKAESFTASSRQRCNQIVFDNPLNQLPYVHFSEERVTSIDGRGLVEPVEGCSGTFDPDAAIPIINPETNQATGESMKQAVLYSLIYSLYFQLAAARDVKVAADAEIRAKE